jgi:hypothetical protein
MVVVMYTMYIQIAMHDSTMVRKQLYITHEQDRALKEQAREEGLSEAEIVREALDRHLRRQSGPVIPEGRRKAIEELLAMSDEIARAHRFPKGYKFDREELYATREDRWLKNRDTE